MNKVPDPDPTCQKSDPADPSPDPQHCFFFWVQYKHRHDFIQSCEKDLILNWDACSYPGWKTLSIAGGQLCWISHSDDKYFDWDHIYRVSRNQAGSSIVLVNNNKSEYTQILSNHDMLNHGFGSLIGSFSSFTMCLLCTFVLMLLLL